MPGRAAYEPQRGKVTIELFCLIKKIGAWPN
jgi:hypothetical protein